MPGCVLPGWHIRDALILPINGGMLLTQLAENNLHAGRELPELKLRHGSKRLAARLGQRLKHLDPGQNVGVRISDAAAKSVL